jgi:hypothetical protein
MNCPSDAILRAKIDNELGSPRLQQVEEHLSSCPKCRQRLETIAAEAERIRQAFAPLQSAGDSSTTPQQALARLEARREAEPASAGWLKSASRVFSAHPLPAWGGAAAIVVAVILTSFAPVRTLGQRVLNMLRVQRVTVVPVDFNLAPGSGIQATIRQLISDQVVETLSPGKPVTAPSASEASKLAGFTVRTLTSESIPPRISVEGEQAYVMTLNQDRLQEVVNELGRPDLKFPASINGATLAVHIGKGVFMRYGNCPDHSSQHGAAEGQPSASSLGCVMMVEVPSPIVSVPPGMDINQVAEIALQAAGMTASEAVEFCQTVDWTSTLVIPVPTRAGSSIQVSVDDVEGTLITGRSLHGRPPRYSLIWVKNGIIYSLMGFGNSANAVALAGSLS